MSVTETISYSVDGDEGKIELKVAKSIAADPKLAAAAAGEDLFHAQGRWGCTWPLWLELFRDEESQGKFLVAMEHVPEFWVDKIAPPGKAVEDLEKEA